MTAARAAKGPFRPICTVTHPTAIQTGSGATARMTMPSEPITVPTTRIGRRLPHRDRVRSEIAPQSGFATIEAAAPIPVTTARIASLGTPADSSAAACAGSRICKGPNHPAATPTMASTKATIHRGVTRVRISGVGAEVAGVSALMLSVEIDRRDGAGGVVPSRHRMPFLVPSGRGGHGGRESWTLDQEHRGSASTRASNGSNLAEA
jgi:hypothetical protein